MKKYTYDNVPLREGDFVKNLSKDQYDEIIEVSTAGFTKPADGTLGFNYPSCDLCWMGSTRTNELDFEEFIRRARNTFVKA